MDDIFESPHPESGNPLSETLRLKCTAGFVETRAALEFDISSTPTGAIIQSADYSFTVVGRTGEHPFEFHGYIGNGIIESDDMNTENLIGGPYAVTSVPATHTIDASSLVIAAIQTALKGTDLF